MTAQTDDRGQMSATKAVSLIVAISVFGILAAVLLPTAIDAIESDTETSITQDVDVTYEVDGELNSTVTAVTAGSDATVELNDTRTAGTTSNTINVGDNETYTLDGGDVDVGVESSSTGPDQAVVNYTYASDYSYSSGASSLWGLLGLAIVLAGILYAVALAIRHV